MQCKRHIQHRPSLHYHFFSRSVLHCFARTVVVRPKLTHTELKFLPSFESLRIGFEESSSGFWEKSRYDSVLNYSLTPLPT